MLDHGATEMSLCSPTMGNSAKRDLGAGEDLAVTEESVEERILVRGRKAASCWRSSISSRSLSLLTSTRASSLARSYGGGCGNTVVLRLEGEWQGENNIFDYFSFHFLLLIIFLSN
ncbi:hypothetical protein LINPERPRIM_LOCUS9974 [Linum perenne]